MVHWDDLGFATHYSVDAEPEFPADGAWGFRVVEIEAGGLVVGGPQAIIRPALGEPWVLSVHLLGIGSIYGTPDPNALCLTDRCERATLVSVVDPARQSVLSDRPIIVAGAPEDGLLLIADEQRVTAFGADGPRWQSARIVEADLRIRRTDNGRIVCRGWNYGVSTTEPVEITLDAATGHSIAPLTDISG